MVEGEPLTLDDMWRPPRGTPRLTLAPPPSDGHPRPTLPEPESRGSLAEAAPTGTPSQLHVGICDHPNPGRALYASGGPLFATMHPTRLEVDRVPNGGAPPPCRAVGCTAKRAVLANLSGYTPFCTGAAHPPSPRPTCAIPRCNTFCYPHEDRTGWFPYCGFTLGPETRGRRSYDPPPDDDDDSPSDGSDADSDDSCPACAASGAGDVAPAVHAYLPAG